MTDTLRDARKPMSREQIEEMAVQEQFLLVCDGLDELAEIAAAVELFHGITAGASLPPEEQSQ
jgi:hypothetical protein